MTPATYTYYTQSLKHTLLSSSISITLLLIFVCSLALSPTIHAATLTVTNINDSGTGSLRQALLDANTLAGVDTITFNIPGASVHTIELLSVLPTITDPVIIDGYSQPGAQVNQLVQGNNATILIELSGRGSSGSNLMQYGLKITAGNSTVKGLAIHSFGYSSPSTGYFHPGIILETNGNTTIQGNIIGTNTLGADGLENGGDGVRIINSTNNTIGGTAPAARNIISGNDNPGISINGVAASGNVIQGNYIGTTLNGNASLSNLHGILISNSPNNTVGGTAPGAGNVISGNSSMGVFVTGADATQNVIQGNFIGTNASGTSALANLYGVYIYGASDNLIGGTSPAARNLISGNGSHGVFIGYVGYGSTSGMTIQGNYIGTDTTGTSALKNADSGVFIAGAFNNLIGGTVAGAGNLISGNGQHGIFINQEATLDTTIQGNIVGLNATASAPLGNTRDGVYIDSAVRTSIGGDSPAAKNIIAYNGGNGVNLGDFRYTAVGTLIKSNTIFSNTLLGIDINLARQATPALLYAYNQDGITTIRGTVAAPAGTALSLQFYTNPVCDPSGSGEGETVLATTTVTSSANDIAQIVFSPANQLPLGQVITLLATDPANNTSRFSNCVTVAIPSYVFLPYVQTVSP